MENTRNKRLYGIMDLVMIMETNEVLNQLQLLKTKANEIGRSL